MQNYARRDKIDRNRRVHVELRNDEAILFTQGLPRQGRVHLRFLYGLGFWFGISMMSLIIIRCARGVVLLLVSKYAPVYEIGAFTRSVVIKFLQVWCLGLKQQIGGCMERVCSQR